MIRESTYQAAISVAATVAEHFVTHLAIAKEKGEDDLAPAPDSKTVEAIIDAAFWASLRREEGRSPKISLAFLSPDQAKKPLLFARRLPFSSSVLTKLAPGVERAGIHVGIWHENGELYIWGTTSDLQSLCFVLDVSEPGLLVVKHRRLEGFGKFVNVAVLKGDHIKIVDESSANIPDCPSLVSSLLGFPSQNNPHSSQILMQLAVSMRSHGRGGSLLIVPANNNAWEGSITKPVTYNISPIFSGLAELMAMNEDEKSEILWQSALRREVDSIAGLTAVDGATIISDRYDLLAFGAKITRADGRQPVEEMIMTEPVIGGGAAIMHPAALGGTRHLSAAQFVHDQRDALALIASQDERFTIFGWSPCDGMLHTH
ncbi:MAG: hypothetical protein M3Q97_10095, partial [Bacteroidota bacterium]|nr:hypothetical protein [Bacteroidota bacterium]